MYILQLMNLCLLPSFMVDLTWKQDGTWFNKKTKSTRCSILLITKKEMNQVIANSGLPVTIIQTHISEHGWTWTMNYSRESNWTIFSLRAPEHSKPQNFIFYKSVWTRTIAHTHYSNAFAWKLKTSWIYVNWKQINVLRNWWKPCMALLLFSSQITSSYDERVLR